MTRQTNIFRVFSFVIIFLVGLVMVGCQTADSAENINDSTDIKTTQDIIMGETNNTPGETSWREIVQISTTVWTEESHSNRVEPNYDVVFPDNEANRIDITIDSENWQAMLDDMTENYGEFGTSKNMRQPGGAEKSQMEFGPGRGMQRPPEDFQPLSQNGFPQDDTPFFASPEALDACNEACEVCPCEFTSPFGTIAGTCETIQDQLACVPEGGPPSNALPENGMMPPMGGGGPMGGPGMMGSTDDNPIWVTSTIEFEDNTWNYVGIRFKGNSSLKSSWGSGTWKLPLKLDFDEFEDEYPEIDDQRFYGFKQLTFSSGFSDDSLLREKVTADIFREAGVPSAHTSFYQVYVDYGEGPIYFGLYTMVEVIDDTVIEEQFEDDSGNVYKPETSGATFAEGTFSEASFDKETNQDEADYSDILALLDVLHSDERINDPATWRSNLESVFDVDGFIKWLAVNTVVQNWDTYGVMSHNYYLYNDPTTNLLTWIPWDNNMALRDDVGKSGTLSLDLGEVNDNWPLIRYLIDDEVYHAKYVDYVEETINGVFEPTKMIETYQELHDLIEPYVVNEDGELEDHTFLKSPEVFYEALDYLTDHVQSRAEDVQAYISSL